MSKPLISLCVCVWNTSHLLKRSLTTWIKQDLGVENFEVIVIDDSSEDDVYSVVEPYMDKMNIRYERLNHSFGMRGNTAAFNRAFELAQSDLLCETTAETCFENNMLRKLYEPHLKEDRIFVAAKTFNLSCDVMLQLDTVDWQSDISNIMLIDGFFNDWTLNNFKNPHFGTHQTCSIKKKLFYEIMPSGFPLFGDYGCEDPFYLGTREENRIKDITIMQPLAFHLWHPHFQYWMAKGKAPHLNKFAHSMSNYMNDTTGKVPEGGTCMIWDGGSHEQLSDVEIAECAAWDDRVRQTGCTVKF